MSLIKFTYLGSTFIVQSFKDNDFANICQLDGSSFRIDFANKTVSTSGKETKEWKEFALKIDFVAIEKKIFKAILWERIGDGLMEYYISKDDNDIPPLPEHLQNTDWMKYEDKAKKLLEKARIMVSQENKNK